MYHDFPQVHLAGDDPEGIEFDAQVRGGGGAAHGNSFGHHGSHSHSTDDHPSSSSSVRPAGRLLVVANRLPYTIKVVKRPLNGAAAVASPPSVSSPPIATPASAFPPTPPSASATDNPYLTAFGNAVLQQARASHHSDLHPHSSSSHSHHSQAPSKKDYTTEVDIAPAPGGLVSALRGVDYPMHWIGWPGLNQSLGRKERNLVRDTLKVHHCSPVFIGPEIWDKYYNGFCNEILWPLFHYIPLSVESLQDAEVKFAAYHEANQMFANMLLRIYRDGDIVWVHDYQLMLLPSILRAAKPDIKVGFFLHTPFPSSEIYRVLPSRKELLRGVLASNLIGFHTHDYARHFQSACTRILGATTIGDLVKVEGQISTVGTFPIGIEPQRFIRALETEGVQHLVRELKLKFHSRKVILGIDRLDYIKGILQKLYSYEKFFEQHPEYIGRVVLIQIAVPSRTEVSEYQKLRDRCHELVGRINGRFGNLVVLPIWYLDCSLSFEHMVSLYRIADIGLITSTRDGMNLVAFEFIACQKDKADQAGVLILSEFAGAAQSLGAGALQVNPWSFQEVSDAIYQALTLTEEQRKERIAYVLKHVTTHTAQSWSRNFLASLEHIVETEREKAAQEQKDAPGAHHLCPPLLNVKRFIRVFARSRKRLLVLGLAGTLSNDRWFGTTTSAAATTPVHNPPSKTPSPQPLFGVQPSSTSVHSLLNTTIGATLTNGSSNSLTDSFVQIQTFSNPPSPPPRSGSGDAVADDTEGNVSLKDPLDCSFTPEMERTIAILAADPSCTLVILTSRSKMILDQLLGQHPTLWLSAENGFFLRKGKVQHVNGAGVAHGNIVHIDAQAPPNAFTHSHPSHPYPHTHSLLHKDGFHHSHATIPNSAGEFESTTPTHHQASANNNAQPTVSTSYDVSLGLTPAAWIALYEHVDLSWKEAVARCFEYFTERTPHSFIADSETHMSWHYHDSEPVFARRQVNDLTTHLTGGPLSNTATEVLDSVSGVVQVRPLGISKGNALRTIMQLLARRHRNHLRKIKHRLRALQLQAEREAAFALAEEEHRWRIAEDDWHAPLHPHSSKSGGLNNFASKQSMVMNESSVYDSEGESTPSGAPAPPTASAKPSPQRRKSMQGGVGSHVMGHRESSFAYAASVGSTRRRLSSSLLHGHLLAANSHAAGLQAKVAAGESALNTSGPNTPSKDAASYAESFKRLSQGGATNSANPGSTTSSATSTANLARRGSWSTDSRSNSSSLHGLPSFHPTSYPHLHSSSHSHHHHHHHHSHSQHHSSHKYDFESDSSSHQSDDASDEEDRSNNNLSRSQSGQSALAKQDNSIEEMLHASAFDFVLVLGNFLERDEDVFTLLNHVMERQAASVIAGQIAAKSATTPGSGSKDPSSSLIGATTLSSAVIPAASHHSPVLSSTQTSSPHFSFRPHPSGLRSHHSNSPRVSHLVDDATNQSLQDSLSLGAPALKDARVASRALQADDGSHVASPMRSTSHPHAHTHSHGPSSRTIVGVRSLHPTQLFHQHHAHVAKVEDVAQQQKAQLFGPALTSTAAACTGAPASSNTVASPLRSISTPNATSIQNSPSPRGALPSWSSFNAPLGLPSVTSSPAATRSFITFPSITPINIPGAVSATSTAAAPGHSASSFSSPPRSASSSHSIMMTPAAPAPSPHANASMPVFDPFAFFHEEDLPPKETTMSPSNSIYANMNLAGLASPLSYALASPGLFPTTPASSDEAALAAAVATLSQEGPTPSIANPVVLTCSVGPKMSKAKFHLADRRSVEELLELIAETCANEQHVAAMNSAANAIAANHTHCTPMREDNVEASPHHNHGDEASDAETIGSVASSSIIKLSTPSPRNARTISEVAVTVDNNVQQ